MDIPNSSPRLPSLFKDSSWLLLGLGGRLIFQFISFLLLAKHLGSGGFGEFASILALATLLSPFVDLGSLNLIIQDTSKGLDIKVAVGKTLYLFLLSVPLGLITFIGFKIIFLPKASWILFFCLGVAELFCNRLVQISFGAHFSGKTYWRNTTYEISNGVIRLLLTIVLIRLNGNVIEWGYLYLIQAIFFSSILIFSVFKTWGKPIFQNPDLKQRIKDGFHFATGSATQTAYTDLDKAMLARFSTFEATGIYAIAYRFTTIAFLPLMALLNAATPRFFKLGSHSFLKARNFATKVTSLTFVYGIFATFFLFFFSDFLVKLLGEEFSQSSLALKYLAFLPLIQTLFFPMADALAGSGLQYIRTRIQIFGLIINFFLNLLFIPKYSWKAAVFSSLFSEILILIITYVFCFKKHKAPA